MRNNRTRTDDSTFELNLAPFLDIIVSIIPMLLLSVAFVQVKMIETPTPQVVNQDANTKPPPQVATVTLKVSNNSGFVFEVTDANGRTTIKKITLLSNKELDYSGLLDAALSIKQNHPSVSQLQLAPDSDVSFDSIIKIMDQVRMKVSAPSKNQASLMDVENNKSAESDYMFPDVVFASVGG